MAEPQEVRDLLPEDAYDGNDPFEERMRVAERAVESVLAADADDEERLRRLPAIRRMIDKLLDEATAFDDRVERLRERFGD